MRVLVTGASGHVGGAIAAHLASQGHEVVGLSRRPIAPAAVEALTADIGSADAVAEVAATAAPCAAIVHAAASLDKALDAPSLALVNVLGTQNMLRLARQWGAARFVYISGVPVIGKPLHLPIDEEHPTNPPTAYHATKLAGEHLTRLAGGDGLGTMSLRVTSPVGPGMPGGRILSAFVQFALAGTALRLAGEGSRKQDYVDVRDVAEAVSLALGSDRQGTVNVGSGKPVSNLELARRCVDALGSTSAVEFTGTADPEEGLEWRVSIERARDWLGFRPQFSIEDSIRAVAQDAGRGNR